MMLFGIREREDVVAVIFHCSRSAKSLGIDLSVAYHLGSWRSESPLSLVDLVVRPLQLLQTFTPHQRLTQPRCQPHP
jgi:hypothetical protein